MEDHGIQGVRTLALATLQQAGLTLVRFGLPALAPFVREDLSLSLVQVGVLLAILDLGSFAAFIPTGIITDRWGERRVLQAGGIVMGMAVALAALTPSYGLLLVGLMLAGIGFPSGHTAGSKIVIRHFPAGSRGLAIGVRQAGLPIGGMAAALLIPFLAGLGGWQLALSAVGLLCAIFGLLCGVLPDPPAGQGQGAGGAMIRHLLSDRDFLCITLMATALVVGQFTLPGYLPLFLVDRHGWTLSAAARLLAWVHFGGIVGRLMWGMVSDRFLKARRQPVMAWVIAGGGVLVLTLSQFPLGGGIGLASALAFFAGLFLVGWNGLFINLIVEKVGASKAATALGVSLTVMFLGTMASPPLFGWVVEVTHSYTPAWLLVALCQVVALLFLNLVREGKGRS
ncbi:MAG: MFS transporter [Candidatus Methylomirabilales bacterium]